jgi:hypothetical protein
MAWEATTQGSEFDAQSSSNTRMGSREGTRDISGGGVGAWLSGLGQDSVVGINANKIPEMRETIRQEVADIQAYLDGIETTASSDGAFKSDEIKASVKNYLDKVKEYSQALISDLLAFSDKLQDVYDAWLASSQRFATDSVDTSANANFAGVTEKYTEVK